MIEEVLTEEDFKMWKNHPLTKRLFSQLQEIKNNMKEEQGTAEVIFCLNNQAVQARLLGTIEGIDIVLNIRLDHLLEYVEEEKY